MTSVKLYVGTNSSWFTHNSKSRGYAETEIFKSYMAGMKTDKRKQESVGTVKSEIHLLSNDNL